MNKFRMWLSNKLIRLALEVAPKENGRNEIMLNVISEHIKTGTAFVLLNAPSFMGKPTLQVMPPEQIFKN